MTNTKIEWTDQVWNPVRGCQLVSAGCANCYAMKQAHRFSGKGKAYEGLTKLTNRGPVWTGKVRLVPEALQAPLKRKKPTRYFVNSMSDLFHEDVPFDFIERIFVVMAAAAHHTFQILTKRPARMKEYINYLYKYKFFKHFYSVPLENIWLGVSIEDQKSADERLHWLLRTDAAIRFISAEPLLENINLQDALYPALLPNVLIEEDLHWVIAGGESGPKARPMHPDWIRSLRDQCGSANIPFFFKQWGGVRKHVKGRTLDNRTWDEYPNVSV